MPRLQCVEYARGAGSAGRAAGGNPHEGEQAAAGNGRKRHAPFRNPRGDERPRDDGHRRIGSRARRRRGGRVADAGGRRPRHRQIDAFAASVGASGAGRRARAVYLRRGIRATDQDARAAAGRDERQSAHPQRKRDGCGRAPLGGNRAGLHDYRLDPDDVPPGHGQRARQRFAGARMCQPADAHGQDDGLRGVPRRPCDQRGRDCRSARARAHGGRGALFRGRQAA